MNSFAGHSDVLIIVGYAAFLLLVAWGFERAARFSHRRVKGFRNLRFRYHEHLGAWQCPEGTYLLLEEIDYERKIARYKAPAHRCNRCSLKSLCTDSPDGRELYHSIRDWSESEMGRFQLVIALTLVVLCSLMLAIAAAIYHSPLDLGLLASAFAGCVAAGIRFARKLAPGSTVRSVNGVGITAQQPDGMPRE